MKKKELVKALYDLGYRKNASREVIDDMFWILGNTLVDRDKIVLRNFGTFEVRDRKGRLGTDPKTHERVMRDDYFIVLFQPSENLKKAIKTGQKLEKFKIEDD